MSADPADRPAAAAPARRARPARDVGVRLIVLYKAVKAVAEVAGAVAVVLLASTGEIEAVRDLARDLAANVTSHVSVLAGRALARLLSNRGVHLLELGLAVDGVVSAFEGYSLWRGYRWGPWIVVLATALPLPLEVLHVARTHHPSRALLIVVNLIVVAYLARRIVRERRGERADLARP